MDRIAIIDLGSNSIRFIVMQIGEQGSYKLIYQEKKSIRLAEGMTQETRLLTGRSTGACAEMPDCICAYY